MEKINEIIRRRAKMDCKLDTQDLKHFELWGEEEIKNCIDEIIEKIKSTLKLFSKMSEDEIIKKEIQKIVYGENELLDLVKIWQEQYRIEKMFYILANNDRRNENKIDINY